MSIGSEGASSDGAGIGPGWSGSWRFSGDEIPSARPARAVQVHRQEVDPVEAVLLPVGLGLDEQHLLRQAVGRVGLLGVAAPQVVLAERDGGELRVDADRPDTATDFSMLVCRPYSMSSVPIIRLSSSRFPLTTIPTSLIYKYMKTQLEGGCAMAAVKVGVSRQVVIPKKIHDKLGLAPGDYLEVEVKRGKVVMTPKALVDKPLEKRLAEGLEDLRAGRSHGPFASAKEAVHFLHTEAKRRKKTKAS